MKTKSLEQLKDEHLGKVGTPKRDEYELRIIKLLEMEQYANQRVIEELERMKADCIGCEKEQCRLLEIDIDKRIKELKTRHERK